MTELLKACKNGDIGKVEYILNNVDTNINFQDSYKNTPLIYASRFNHVDIVNLLINYEKNGVIIDPNIKGYDGNTALTYASKYGNTEIVKLLLSNKRVGFCIDPNIDTRGTGTSPRGCRYSK